MSTAAGAEIHQHVNAVAGTAYGVIGADLHVFGDGTPLYLLEEHRRHDVSDRAWLRELPSRMLNARAGVVAFTGRDRERDELHAWLAAGPRLAVRWLHAPGGQGKTRLADHIAAHAAACGWKVVVAVPHVGTPTALQDSQDLRLDGHRGVLLIVDYADRYPLSTLIWLLRNSLLHQPDQPARVLMLARGASAWPALRATLEDPGVQAGTSEHYLNPLPDDAGDRWAMFTAARDSFAAIYQLPNPAVIAPPIGLDHPEFGLTLTVHVAALVAVDAHATGDQPPTHPEQLTRHLLDRERQHWTRLYEGRTRGLDHHTPDSVMARTVFTAALTGALPHPEATTLLRRVEHELPVERILTDHGRCYPPTDPNQITALEPLYPDRLAEDFIAHTLPGPHHPAEPWAPTRLNELLQPPPPSAKRRWWSRRSATPTATTAYLARAVTFLTAAAARWPHLGPAHLYPLLRAQPQLAIIAGSATLTTLAAIPNIDLDVLEAVEALLPDSRHVDLDIGAAAITTTLTRHRLATTSDPAEHARLHADHAFRLDHAGRWEEALTAAEEAASLYRRLAAVNPAAYLPDLASSLNNLGIQLSEVGHREEALPLAEEAAAICRRLAEVNPAAHLPNLAGSLNNLGEWLSKVGRREEALAPAEEAVAIRRRLAEVNPAAYLPDLASSLNNLGIRLSEVGRREEALAPVEEAVAIRRRLAEANPAANLPNLARSLNNLGVRLSEVGRWEEALPLAEETAGLYRRLAEVNPAAYLPDLASSLNNLGIRLSNVGRWEEALPLAEETAGLYRRLAEVNPAAHLPDLASSLNSLGVRLSEVGRREEALRLAQEATGLYWRLAEVNPAAYLPNFASSLNNLGLRLSEVGYQAEALPLAEEATGLYRRLAEVNPAAYLPRLANSLNNHGILLLEVGHREEALPLAEEAAAICRRLAEVNPAAYLPHLAGSLNNLGVQLSEVGRQEEALALVEEAVAIHRRLAEANPAANLPDLARSLLAYARVGANVDAEMPRALAAVTESIGLYEPLARQLPQVFTDQLATAQQIRAAIIEHLSSNPEP
ncbi:tetratricopeptide repeat protein [Micromonospora sp. NPDC048999]|uniref:tetratricopeptide repeat protein n=1 Tax=Micromonospora sp. NPDC048999 TaxID=3155391 RepID=UPI0033EE4568